MGLFYRTKRTKDGLQQWCTQCCKENRNKNHERYARQKREYVAANAEKVRKCRARYYEKNKKTIAAKDAAYVALNSEHIKERNRAYHQKNRLARNAARRLSRLLNASREKAAMAAWARTNVSRLNALSANRRARRIRAMPSWANVSRIYAIYAEARRLTKESGIPHDVDHIVPLKGKFVSGLHVETNLQILPAVLNRKKHNHFSEAA